MIGEYRSALRSRSRSSNLQSFERITYHPPRDDAACQRLELLYYNRTHYPLFLYFTLHGPSRCHHLIAFPILWHSEHSKHPPPADPCCSLYFRPIPRTRVVEGLDIPHFASTNLQDTPALDCDFPSLIKIPSNTSCLILLH